jgi:alginate biosynthesis protein AlgX
MAYPTKHGCGLSLSLITCALLGLPLAAQAQEAAAPSYTAEPCCQLCPQAAERSRYPKGFMSSFTTLVQGQDNWLFRTDIDLMTNFATPPEGLAQLKRLNDALKAHGTQLVIVYQPTRGLVHPNRLSERERAAFNYDAAVASYRKTLGDFEKLGIVAPDLTSLFNEKADEEKPYFFLGDHHWTPYGAERTAEVVADQLQNLPAIRQLPKTEFVTRPVGLLAKRGTLQKAAAQICGNESADQYVTRFETEPANVASSSDDLFADESGAEIVLVGTSNSGDAINFNGFLQQALERKIKNFSVVGGSLEGAIIQYLASEEFRQKPAKVLIWEFGAYNNLAQRDFYREVVPLATSNGCATGKPTLARKDLTLHNGDNELLVNTAAKDLTGSRYLLDVKFNDPSIKEMKGTVWYTTGKKDEFKIERPASMDTQGRFVLELRDDAAYRGLGVLGIDLQLPEGAAAGKTKVNATLCPRQTPRSSNVAGI